MSVDPTFLFSDIEGSTRNWEEHASLMAGALTRHDELMTQAIDRRRGTVVKHTGDGMLAVFSEPTDALLAAVETQRALVGVTATVIEPLRVRMGIHCGPAVQIGADFFGPTVNRCARLMAVAHGGQVILTKQVVDAIGDDAAPFDLIDLGDHQLRDVSRPVRVFQLAASDLPAEFPPLKTVRKSEHNLPAPVSSFIGRVKLLEKIDDVLGRQRLVTIVGAGGCGKTRLAVEAAAARVAQHPDGAWLVELADVSTGRGVPGAIATVLRVQEETGQSVTDTLCNRLERSDLLIVLDNCEHVIGDVARLTRRLLGTSPRLRVLATSRQPLGISGEALLVVDPLEVPCGDPSTDAGSDAVRLFLDRAALVRPDFNPVGDELAAVARVCRQLEGIPLAIELAAARLNVLSVVQLERRLDRRFALLTGSVHRSARHRTLRATVEWSYDLLGRPEQRAWSTLSVFVGGFDLEAATFLLEVNELDAIDLLSALVNRSILQASVGDRDVRYRMLETIRDFGREKLVESDALMGVRSRHRAWALEMAARAEPEHMTNRGPEWHNRFDLEYPNLRLAIESGLEDGAPHESLRLCADLGVFFWLRGHLSHGRDWCERSLAASDEADVGLRGRGLFSLGTLMYGQLDFPASRPTLEMAVRLARSVGDEPTVGWASIFLAVIHASHDDADEAQAALDEALHVAEHNVIPSVCAAAYYIAGVANASLGDEVEATKYLELAVDLAREAGSPYTLARSLPLIARRLHTSGNHDAAMVTFEEAIDLARSTGDRVGLARSLQYVAERHIASGEYERATTRLEEVQPIVSREIDDAWLACRVELTSATLWRHRGHAITAQAHLDRALAWASGLEGWRSSMDPYIVQAELAIDRGDRGSALVALARSKESARRAKHVERLARALLHESRVLAALGRLNEANASLAEAEEHLAATDDPMVRALLGHARGCVARADRRYADAVTSLRDAAGAATAAGALPFAVECNEELALALHAADPADHLPSELLASATAERLRMGTPRPAPRAEEFDKLDVRPAKGR